MQLETLRRCVASVGCRLFTAALICLSTSSTVCADDEIEIAQIEHDGPVDFQKEILPILRKSCLACHNSTNAESDLSLETPDSILKGGSEGPAAVAGENEQSLLIRLAAHRQEPFMPPPDNDVQAKPLSSAELGLLSLWIEQGAQATSASDSAVVKFQPVPPQVNPILAAAISPNGQFVAAGRANQVFMYHLPSRRKLGQLTDPALLDNGLYRPPGVAHLDLVQSLAFSPDNETVASGGYRTVKLWRREPLPPSEKLAQLQDGMTTLAATVDGRRLALADRQGRIVILDSTTGDTLVEISAHPSAVTALAFSKDGSKIASAAEDRTIRSWDLETGSQLGAPIEVPQTVRSLALLDNHQNVAAALEDTRIRVWPLSSETRRGDTDTDSDRTRPEAVVLKGHSAAVTSLAAVPSADEQLVSGSQDETWQLWDVTAEKMVRQGKHGSPITSIAVSPDGARLATCGAAGTTKLWDLASGKELAAMRGDFIAEAAVGQAQRELALARRGNEDAGKELEAAKKRHADEMTAAKKAQEEQTAAQAGFDKKKTAAQQALQSKESVGKQLAQTEKRIPRLEKRINATPVAIKGFAEVVDNLQAISQLIADARLDHEQTATQPLQQVIRNAVNLKSEIEAGGRQATIDLKAAQDQLKALTEQLKKETAAADKAIDEQNASLRALEAAQRKTKRAKETVQRVAAEVPDFQRAVDDAQRLLEDRAAALKIAETAWNDSIRAATVVRFSVDGTMLATATDSASIALWDGRSGVAVDRLDHFEEPPQSLAFDADGKILICAGRQVLRQSLDRPWRLRQVIGTINSQELADRVTALAFSPDGKLLATGSGEPSRNGQLRLWSVNNGSLVRDIPEPHSDTVLSLDFSPDGEFLAASAADRFLKVFEVGTGKLVRSFEGHTGHVLGVSWRADGRVLASGGADNVVKIWDFRTGDQKRTIDGFAKQVTAVRFTTSADGKNIAELVASCGDRQVHTKNSDNGKSGPRFTGASDFVYCVDASADGSTVIAGGEDSVLRVWQRDGKLIVAFQPERRSLP